MLHHITPHHTTPPSSVGPVSERSDELMWQFASGLITAQFSQTFPVLVDFATCLCLPLVGIMGGTPATWVKPPHCDFVWDVFYW